MPVGLHPLYYIVVLMEIRYRTNGQINVRGRLWLSETWFLGDFAKLRKGTISFIICPSARLFVHREQVGSQQKGFRETRYFITFRKYVEKILVLLKSEKNNGYFTCRPMHIYGSNSSILLRWRNFYIKFVEKIKKQFLNNIFPEILTFMR